MNKAIDLFEHLVLIALCSGTITAVIILGLI